jgi:hypothetical protein
VATYDVPMLGVAGDFGHAEVTLARRFDELHQLLYAKGGVRPTNAAIEEVSKLLFLRLWATRLGTSATVGGTPVGDLFRGRVPSDQVVEFTKAAFLEANLSSALGAKDPSGAPQPLWPVDEPFRLANADVLERAATLVDEVVRRPGDVLDAEQHRQGDGRCRLWSVRPAGWLGSCLASDR